MSSILPVGLRTHQMADCLLSSRIMNMRLDILTYTPSVRQDVHPSQHHHTLPSLSYFSEHSQLLVLCLRCHHPVKCSCPPAVVTLITMTLIVLSRKVPVIVPSGQDTWSRSCCRPSKLDRQIAAAIHVCASAQCHGIGVYRCATSGRQVQWTGPMLPQVKMNSNANNKAWYRMMSFTVYTGHAKDDAVFGT